MKWKIRRGKRSFYHAKIPQGALQQMWCIDFILVWSNPQNLTKITFVDPVLNKEKIPTYKTFRILQTKIFGRNHLRNSADPQVDLEKKSDQI